MEDLDEWKEIEERETSFMLLNLPDSVLLDVMDEKNAPRLGRLDSDNRESLSVPTGMNRVNNSWFFYSDSSYYM